MDFNENYIEPKEDESSESFNLCDGCGCSWCECGFENEEVN